jgi:rare lipoprotein A (peptidoglycan hydrolase)
MKKIIAIFLVIFISSLILNNFFAGLATIESSTVLYNNNNIDTLKIDTLKIETVDTLKIDTLNLSKGKEIIKNESSKKPEIENKPKKYHNATWYKTNGTRVHREYPTAAYNLVPRGTKLLVTNILTGDTCVVEVTDRHKMGRNHIDLSHSAFGKLAKHSIGTIKVLVEQL